MIISTLYITALLLTAATAFTAFHVPSRYAVRNRVLMKEDCALAVISQAIKSKEVPKAEVVKAVQTIERTYKAKPAIESSTKGKWQLVFTNNPNAFESGFLLGGFLDGYFGSKEEVVFCDKGKITLKGGLLSPGRYQGDSEFISSKPLTLEYIFKDFKVGLIGQDGMGQITRQYRFLYVDERMAVTRILPSGACAILKKV